MDGKPTKTAEEKARGYEKRAVRRSIRALHNAILQNNLSKVQELLTPNIDVNFHYGGQTALQIAVTNGFEDISQYLIDHKADINKNNAEDNSLLNMAVWRGYYNISKALVEGGADLNTCNNHGSSPLNTAAYIGCSDIANLLVNANCEIDSCNNKGRSPLITSAFKGWPEITQTLVEGQCDLDWTDHERQTALIVAAEKGHTEVVRALVNAKCNLDAREKFGCTALLMASKHGHADVVKLLIAAGANLNQGDSKGNTPVMEAVKHQHLEIVRQLTKAACNVNLKEVETKQAPIHAAVRLATQYFGPKDIYTDLVQVLIDAGCDVNLSDSGGWTPLYQAAFGGEADIVELLLKHQASVETRTDNGNTILHAAVISNKLDILDMVLAAGCSVDSPNAKHEIPLYTAIKYRAKIKIVERLVSAGTPLDVCESESGQSPLFCAIQQHFVEAVDCLIKAGCDVNLSNYDGDSPLWVACNMGSDTIVQTLLKQPRIDIDAGISHIPLHAAATHGHFDISEMLLKAGADVNKLTDLCVSALYLATDRNHASLVHLLIKWGANPSIAGSIKPPKLCCKHYKDEHPHLEIDPLYAAVKNDNFKVINMIIMASPRRPYKTITTLRDLIFRTNFAQEARLSQTTIYQYASFFAGILRTPATLQMECRGVIQTVLGSHIGAKVKNLPIPTKLKDYITHKSELESVSP